MIGLVQISYVSDFTPDLGKNLYLQATNESAPLAPASIRRNLVTHHCRQTVADARCCTSTPHRRAA
jgi:hypothetical protein